MKKDRQIASYPLECDLTEWLAKLLEMSKGFGVADVRRAAWGRLCQWVAHTPVDYTSWSADFPGADRESGVYGGVSVTVDDLGDTLWNAVFRWNGNAGSMAALVLGTDAIPICAGYDGKL
ncbi:hypothetical protein ACSBOB_31605 [Mesorhizobium sp. ASY16-5R]|uniref:hypothetical protein n=1 Tax=Mesorhizobium sp. ASY16-5R TaxID=3445772 RepID=UPI003FA1387C